MDKTTEPGDIPAWKQSLITMTAPERVRLALAVGVSPTTVGNWVAGRNTPSAATIDAIERRLRKRGKA